MNQKNVITILVVINFILLLLYVLMSNKLIFTEEKLEQQKVFSDKIDDYMLSKTSTEGKYIWDTGILTKSEFIKIEITTPKIFLWIDSIDCSSCYEFHLRRIKNEFGINKTIIVYNKKITFLKLDFKNYYFIDSDVNNKIFSQLVALVEPNGKIIYADFPQYALYNYSGKFYEIVERYLIN